MTIIPLLPHYCVLCRHNSLEWAKYKYFLLLVLEMFRMIMEKIKIDKQSHETDFQISHSFFSGEKQAEHCLDK